MFAPSHEKTVGLFGLYHYVIHICLDHITDEVVEALLHTTLAGCTCVFQSERHRHVAVSAEGSDERCSELIGLAQADLVVSGVRI